MKIKNVHFEDLSEFVFIVWCDLTTDELNELDGVDHAAKLTGKSRFRIEVDRRYDVDAVKVAIEEAAAKD